MNSKELKSTCFPRMLYRCRSANLAALRFAVPSQERARLELVPLDGRNEQTPRRSTSEAIVIDVECGT
jgi:hypothetical protein